MERGILGGNLCCWIGTGNVRVNLNKFSTYMRAYVNINLNV